MLLSVLNFVIFCCTATAADSRRSAGKLPKIDVTPKFMQSLINNLYTVKRQFFFLAHPSQIQLGRFMDCNVVEQIFESSELGNHRVIRSEIARVWMSHL
jgi:hypothetical protein